MRRTKEDAEITRQQLLDAALKLFANKGYAATRLAEIAREVGVTSGAIYWHFGSKQELLIALIKQETAPFFEIVNSTFKAELGPIEKIRRLVTTVLEKIETEEKFKNQNRMRDITERNDELLGSLRNYFQEHFQNFLKEMVKVMENGQASGEIRTDISAPALTVFIARFMGSYADGRGEKILGPNRSIDGKTMATLLVSAIKA